MMDAYILEALQQIARELARMTEQLRRTNDVKYPEETE